METVEDLKNILAGITEHNGIDSFCGSRIACTPADVDSILAESEKDVLEIKYWRPGKKFLEIASCSVDKKTGLILR